jgi:metallo-beta-lactamase family protein
MNVKVRCLGAAGEVTGSCYRVDTGPASFLVDCGMFQGGREAYGKNRQALDFNVREIDFVLLTHAHIDHSGLLPRLTAMGFRGPIYTSHASIDLLKILLPDSAHIQEKEAEWALRGRNKRGRQTLGVPTPLYSVTQAEACLRQLCGVNYDEMFSPVVGVSIRLRDAGHILGSAMLEITFPSGKRIVFSGDLGQPDRPVLRDPVDIDFADLLFIESTYGDRRHRSMAETEQELIAAFNETIGSGRGNVIIPAFAVGRTQEILCVLADLVQRQAIPPLQVYVDSPMATSATEITFRHFELLDDETRAIVRWLEGHPGTLKLRFVADVAESIELNDLRHGAVIISASGMCDAGRIKHHLRYNLGRPECTVLITGFQAAGTLGRRLVDGARVVRIFGEQVAVRAKIRTVGGLSAHADQAALLNWLGKFRRPPGQIVITHGERGASEALSQAIVERFGGPQPRVPVRGEVIEWMV